MGNSESSVKNETILSDARPSLTENISRSLELLEEIEMENVIISLNWVDSCSNNAALLQHIADEIIRLSLAAPYTSSLSMNYLNLAKKLSHFTVSDTREVETFRDIFLKVCFEYYEACKSNEQEFNKTKKLSQFLGNLYNVGIVSSAFLSYWLRSLNSLSQTMILQVIKSKVEQEFEKPEPELCILEMRTMLIERKLIQIETVSHQSMEKLRNWIEMKNQTIAQEIPRQSSDDFDTDQFVVGARSNHLHSPLKPISQAKDVPTASQKTSKDSFNVSTSFETYLETIGTCAKYECQVFKTCTDTHRKNCAQHMLNFVKSHPQNINNYVNLTRDIISNGSLSSNIHKTFIMHLIDLITEELNKNLQRGSPKYWDEFTNIGSFIAQVYKLGLLKPALLYRWLDGVHNLSSSDINASKAYIGVLHIVLNKMTQIDTATYKKHLNNLANLYKRKSSQSTVFNENYQRGILSKASSMSSVKSEESSTSRNKTTLPTATTKICTDFQKYLNNLETGKKDKIDINQFQSCSEATLRGCALILVEHALLHPEKAKLYAASTTNSVLPNIARKEMFIQRVAEYIDLELVKWLKLENPEKSNWKRIMSSGTFLAELYNFEVVSTEVIAKWVGKIQQAVVMDSPEATAVVMAFYKSLAEKIKAKDASSFNHYMNGIERTRDDKKIVLKFHEMLNNPLKFKTPTYTFVQQKPNSIQCKNVFEELQRLVNGKMNFGNQVMIINEIAALKISGTEENLRKITNVLVSRAKQRPDMIASASQVLAFLPEKAKYDVSEFRNQIRQSLLRQLGTFCNQSKVDKKDTTNFAKFVKELHWRSAIGIKVLSRTVEELAIKVRTDPKIGLQILLLFVQGLGKDLVIKIKVTQLTETVTTLQVHSKNKKIAQETLKECEEVMQWINGDLKTTTTKETALTLADSKPLQSQSLHSSSKELSPVPSTSTAKILTKQKEEMFSISLDGDINDLKAIFNILQITPLKMKNFVESFLNAAIKSEENFAEFSQLAKIIDEHSNKDLSFKDKLVSLVQTQWCDIVDETTSKDEIESLVKFTAELYKIGWIRGEFLTALMESFAINNFERYYKLKLFYILLQTTSLTMVKNNDCDKIAYFHKMLVENQEAFTTTKSNLIALETMDMLDSMMLLNEGSAQEFNEKQFREILDCINSESVGKIKALSIKTTKNLRNLVKLIVQKAAGDPDDAYSCAKLAVELKELKVGETATTDLLLEICLENLQSYLSVGLKLPKLSDTIGLLQFIGELYLVEIFSFDIINLCLELISEDQSCDNATDCLKVLLKTVGWKVEKENSEKLDKYFETFEKSAEIDESKTAWRELIEMRKNGWCEREEITAAAETTVAKILNNLSRENLKLSAVTLKNVINKSEKNSYEVMQDLWKFVINGSSSKIHAELCVEISSRHEAFLKQFVSFLQRRHVTFRSIKNEDFSESVKKKLSYVISFVANLFVSDFLSESAFEIWIQCKLARHLSVDVITQLIAEVDTKITNSKNVRIRAAMLNLEEVAHEKTIRTLRELNKDIKEVLETIEDINTNQKLKKNEKVESESL